MQGSGEERSRRALYAEIHAVADEAHAHAGANTPVGAPGRLWRALDEMKQRRCPAEDVALAEEISLAMHRLRTARQVAGPADPFRLRLGELARAWIERLPLAYGR